MSKADTAGNYFEQKFSCSQAVFGAFAESLGMDIDTAMKVSDCFRGGMCMTDVCGAYTGGLMAIGLKHGRSEADDAAARDLSGNMTTRFTEEFKGHTGGKLTCKDMLGGDMRTEEGKAKMKEQSLRNNVCMKAVCKAGEILEEMGI